MNLSDEQRIKNAIGRYNAACHAMQSGVKFDQETGSNDGTPKHLRVGVNSALVNDFAIAKLLIAKGVITPVEYQEAVAEAMEEEVKRYEATLSKKLGSKISLA